MFYRRYCFDFCFTCSGSIGAQQIKVLSRVKIVISSRKVKHSEMTDKRYVTGAFRQAAVCALITEVLFGDTGWARLLIEANSTQTYGIGIVWVVFLRESPWWSTRWTFYCNSVVTWAFAPTVQQKKRAAVSRDRDHPLWGHFLQSCILFTGVAYKQDLIQSPYKVAENNRLSNLGRTLMNLIGLPPKAKATTRFLGNLEKPARHVGRGICHFFFFNQGCMQYIATHLICGPLYHGDRDLSLVNLVSVLIFVFVLLLFQALLSWAPGLGK